MRDGWPLCQIQKVTILERYWQQAISLGDGRVFKIARPCYIGDVKWNRNPGFTITPLFALLFPAV